MSDDLLQQATQALRESTATDSHPRFTRGRIMATLHRRERRRLSRAALLLPIAAVLIGSSALAASNPSRSFAALIEVLGLSASPDSTAEPAAPPRFLKRARRVSSAFRASTRLARTDSPASLVEPPPAETALEPSLEPAADRTARAPVLSAAAPGGAPVLSAAGAPPKSALRSSKPAAPDVSKPAVARDSSLELYQRAHHLHFAAGNPSLALAAWDAYLAQAPEGRLAYEARYNRAICLVRLGRQSQARTALEPFARGTRADYRQKDASALLEALDAPSEK